MTVKQNTKLLEDLPKFRVGFQKRHQIKHVDGIITKFTQNYKYIRYKCPTCQSVGDWLYPAINQCHKCKTPIACCALNNNPTPILKLYNLKQLIQDMGWTMHKIPTNKQIQTATIFSYIMGLIGMVGAIYNFFENNTYNILLSLILVSLAMGLMAISYSGENRIAIHKLAKELDKRLPLKKPTRKS